MKTNTLLLVSFLTALVSFASPREVTIETKSIDGVMHWTPSQVNVTAGETIKLIAKHDVEGGFDFHGLSIPVLKIAKQVNRHKPETIEVKIPASLKPGNYPMACQFHAKHKPAELVVAAPAAHP